LSRGGGTRAASFSGNSCGDSSSWQVPSAQCVFKEHDCVAQICSGGAGTSFGPGGFMGDGAYHHFVQASIDASEFRLQTVDIDGNIRETYSRPVNATGDAE
jgi:hypothetical protein